MTSAYIQATGWCRPIYLVIGKERKRIPNWYRLELDKNGDSDEFTWGYYGTGCGHTAYSILREIFGQEVAERHYSQFVVEYISQLDQNRGFRLYLRHLTKIVGGLECKSLKA
jgi:hypothetical protein